MKHVYLRNDKDLMEMFGRCAGKNEIDIWMGADIVPCSTLLLARNLRTSKVVKTGGNNGNGGNVTEPVPRPIHVPVPVPIPAIRQKLPFKRRRQSDNELPVNDIPTVSQHVLNTPSNSNSVTSPRRNPRLTKALSTTAASSQLILATELSQATENPPQLTQATQLNHDTPSENPSKIPQPTKIKKKLPKTSAKRAGSYVVKTQSKTNLGQGSSSRTKRGGRVDYDQLSEEDDSDNSYIPSENGEVDEEEDFSDLEDEDNLVTSAMEFIDDGYVPFGEHTWSGEEGGYIGQVFKNGEVYETKEFGSICLRPWMLFMDKEHFKDVLRDYCIQEGFTLVVVKADNKRYTADCATLDCQWRIHATVLQDGITWAIKTIRNPEHGCEGIRTNNPMANCAWVAKKLIEDIRANPINEGFADGEV